MILRNPFYAERYLYRVNRQNKATDALCVRLSALVSHGNAYAKNISRSA